MKKLLIALLSVLLLVPCSLKAQNYSYSYNESNPVDELVKILDSFCVIMDEVGDGEPSFEQTMEMFKLIEKLTTLSEEHGTYRFTEMDYVKIVYIFSYWADEQPTLDEFMDRLEEIKNEYQTIGDLYSDFIEALSEQ